MSRCQFWTESEVSTAELMKDLCETISDDLAIAEHLRLAVDLQQAKLKVHRIAQWQ